MKGFAKKKENSKMYNCMDINSVIIIGEEKFAIYYCRCFVCGVTAPSGSGRCKTKHPPDEEAARAVSRCHSRAPYFNNSMTPSYKRVSRVVVSPTILERTCSLLRSPPTADRRPPTDDACAQVKKASELQLIRTTDARIWCCYIYPHNTEAKFPCPIPAAHRTMCALASALPGTSSSTPQCRHRVG